MSSLIVDPGSPSEGSGTHSGVDRQVDGQWQECSCLAVSCQLLAGLPSANQLNLLGREYIQWGPLDNPLDCGWMVSEVSQGRWPSSFIPRTQFLDQPSASSAWMEPRSKEAANHCALLQEHAQRCYVRGERGATGRSVREETWGPWGPGLGRPCRSLTLVALSTSVRAVPEFAASTERDLPGLADGSGCL